MSDDISDAEKLRIAAEIHAAIEKVDPKVTAEKED
jgi:hypothetical protein